MSDTPQSNQKAAQVESPREFSFTIQIIRITGVPAETKQKASAVLARYIYI